MAGRKPGRAPAHDWAILMAEYDADYLPENKSLKEFCLERKLDPTVTSNSFQKERRRSAMAAFHGRNKPLLLKAQQSVLIALEESKTWKNRPAAAKFALDVLEKVAEREEPNPLLAQQFNVVLPPMFPAGSLASKAIEALTGKPVMVSATLPSVAEPAKIIEPAPKVKAKPKKAKEKS